MICIIYCGNIHEEMIEMDNAICPFCDKQLVEIKHLSEPCCEKQDMINDNGKNVCTSCGTVHYYDTTDGYIDFHENKFKISRKSIYYRKYHILNVLLTIDP